MSSFFSNILSFPLFLTLLRLVASPTLLPVLLVFCLPYNSFFLNGLMALLFLLLGLTDFFDGYLARKHGQETWLGRILDPIADKFLVYCALVSLLAVSKIRLIWVIVFIGREFFMMGLRQVALEHSLSVPVSIWGKIKTALQIALLTVIIANPYQQYGLSPEGFVFNAIEYSLLSLAVLFSLGSAGYYYRQFIIAFNNQSLQ